MSTTYQVHSYLGFRIAARGVTLHTAERLARAIRKVSGCGWVVSPVASVTVDGVEVPPDMTGIVGGYRLCDAIRDPRVVVEAAWA